jgi:hypothetical protein
VSCEWSLTAGLAGDRLLVTLLARPDLAAQSVDPLAGADMRSLHDRLGQLFGPSAQLNVSAAPSALTLDMPRLREDSDDDRIDREPALAAGAADLPVHAT